MLIAYTLGPFVKLLLWLLLAEFVVFGIVILNEYGKM